MVVWDLVIYINGFMWKKIKKKNCIGSCFLRLKIISFFWWYLISLGRRVKGDGLNLRCRLFVLLFS